MPPISFLNCSFKIVLKVPTNTLVVILQRLIASKQFVFLKGRFILDSVVTAHEVLHYVHSSLEQGLVLKLDYEKAFDKVNLDFLVELLEIRCFGSKWSKLIHQITHGVSVGVKINNVESDFFITDKGLTQRRSLSPLLFNLVVDLFPHRFYFIC